MVRGTDSELPLDADQRRRLRDILRNNDVALAAAFGSTVRGDDDPADLDLAIEFEDYRPGDDGYASVYLRLFSALEDALGVEIDLVDVHSMAPGFASAALSEAVLLVGDADRLDALARWYEADSPSATDARERIVAAADRLGKGST
jgi:predicted nucleotidyltransferase